MRATNVSKATVNLGKKYIPLLFIILKQEYGHVPIIIYGAMPVSARIILKNPHQAVCMVMALKGKSLQKAAADKIKIKNSGYL